MANIELPKDAEGREIPLDTEVLYDEDGTKVSVKEFLSRTLVESQKIEWIIKAQYEGNLYYNSFEPKNMRLTQPDSWEKLEEDLNRAVENDNSGESDSDSMACAYMNHSGDMCGDCKFREKYARDCTNQMLEDVVSRIRELRSDSE